MHKNLYIARKEQRMTQEKAANLIHIAPRTILLRNTVKVISP